MTWMGHKRIEETMRYVHFAGAHMRPIPVEVLLAGNSEVDPNRRVILMLGGRGNVVAKTIGDRREAA